MRKRKSAVIGGKVSVILSVTLIVFLILCQISAQKQLLAQG